MKKRTVSYLAELVGTFTFVFIGTSVATLQGFLSGYGETGWLGIAFAFGGTLAVLVWVIGPISGCHVNPAVTIPMALAGRIKPSLVVGYLVSQLVGALAASALLLALLGGIPGYDVAQAGLGANGNPRDMSVLALLGWETLMTALFVFVIFTVTARKAPAGIAGAAIGGFLFLAYLIGAPLGDSSLNPARSFGPAVIVGGQALGLLWVFVLGPIVGGIIGWLLHTLVSRD